MNLLLSHSLPGMISWGKPSPIRLMVLLIMLALVGCSSDSGGPAPDPLAAYKSQVVNWQTCDEGILGVDRLNLMKKAQEKLGERLKCAMITVPMDYANPSKGDLQIAIMRTAAGKQGVQKEGIFFNPGGPGSDGLGLAAATSLKFENLDAPNDVIAAELKKMGDRFELIGFSPRGVGASTQLICASNEQTKRNFPFPWDMGNETIQNTLYNTQLETAACQKNPLTPYINTEQTVRDMDLIRHLLGYEKLNYIGYSYGTWLGAWYAGRFPERAGRMLLDSNVDFSRNFEDLYLARAIGEQRLYDEVFAPFAARNNDRLALGNSPEEVRTVFPALQPLWLKGQTYGWTDQSTNTGTDTLESNAFQAMITLRSAQVLQQLHQKHPNIASLDEWELIISQTLFSPDVAINEQAKKRAFDMKKAYSAPVSGGSNFLLGNESAVRLAIRCNDTPYTHSQDFWIDTALLQFVQYPFFGAQVLNYSCPNWPAPKVQKPSMAEVNRASEGILMLQSRYDALTRVEGALQTFERLSKSSMIMVEREYQHGLFPYSTECVDLAVARYFNEGILPERYTVCDGKTDIIPPTTAQAAKAAVNAPKSIDRRSTVYRDLAKDEEITRIIRSMIR